MSDIQASLQPEVRSVFGRAIDGVTGRSVLIHAEGPDVPAYLKLVARFNRWRWNRRKRKQIAKEN